LLLVAAVELGLRLGGYGYPTTFFVATGDGQTLVPNRRFGWQFMRRETATQPYPVTVSVQKPPGTTRIFILGESAAQGTPAPAFSFSRILEAMLRERSPGRRFEVINVAMRGIDSHVVRAIARECARLAPDLFLVYMGNNEIIGLHSPEPDGVDFTRYLPLVRLSQWLKRTKLAQLTNSLIHRPRKNPSKQPEQDMVFFRGKRLAADSRRRQPVYHHFQANLEEICRIARASGAQVIVSTVAVNLLDFPPLASLHRESLTPAELGAWESAYARGTNAEARGEFDVAFTNYFEARRVDDHFAELHFRLARCARAAGSLDSARKHFALARDWDALQFRADSRLNQIVRDTVASRADPGLLLLDAEGGFAEQAGPELRVPGDRFFHEHVHLKFEGDYLLAKLFLPMVAQALDLTGSAAPSGTPANVTPSLQQCADALAFTEWDEICVRAAMVRLTSGPPFLDQLGHARRQADAERLLTRQEQLFQTGGGFERAVATYRAATARHPEDWQLHYNFGSLLRDFGDKAGATTEFTTAVGQMPFFPALRMLLAQTLWEQGRRGEAIQEYQRALRVDPDYTPAKAALAQALGTRSGR